MYKQENLLNAKIKICSQPIMLKVTGPLSKYFKNSNRSTQCSDREGFLIQWAEVISQFRYFKQWTKNGINDCITYSKLRNHY